MDVDSHLERHAGIKICFAVKKTNIMWFVAADTYIVFRIKVAFVCPLFNHFLSLRSQNNATVKFCDIWWPKCQGGLIRRLLVAQLDGRRILFCSCSLHDSLLLRASRSQTVNRNKPRLFSCSRRFIIEHQLSTFSWCICQNG